MTDQTIREILTDWRLPPLVRCERALELLNEAERCTDYGNVAGHPDYVCIRDPEQALGFVGEATP